MTVLRETSGVKQERMLRAKFILRSLKKLFPKAGMMLSYGNNWELMVAVQLSAQCTDRKVNEVTPALFARYPHFKDYLTADTKEFEQLIYQTGFYRNKTRNILAAAEMLEDRFHAKLPRTMAEMLLLPGVARKTANVVLGNAYGLSFGIAVDTHVKRLSHVFGLSDAQDPVRIERDLMELFPKKEWFRVTYLFIEYGRVYCPARKHNHATCPLGLLFTETNKRP